MISARAVDTDSVAAAAAIPRIVTVFFRMICFFVIVTS